MDSAVTTGSYNYKVVRQFAVMTVVWGIVGMIGAALRYRGAAFAFPDP